MSFWERLSEAWQVGMAVFSQQVQGFKVKSSSPEEAIELAMGKLAEERARILKGRPIPPDRQMVVAGPLKTLAPQPVRSPFMADEEASDWAADVPEGSLRVEVSERGVEMSGRKLPTHRAVIGLAKALLSVSENMHLDGHDLESVIRVVAGVGDEEVSEEEMLMRLAKELNKARKKKR